MFMPNPIAAAVDSIARQAVGKDWNLYAALLSHWREIVGENYAEKTTPVKISFPKGKPAEENWAQKGREDGVLHIRLPQGLVMEFTFLTEQIKQRIAAYFGYKAIARVVFEPYYGEERPATADLPLLAPEETAKLKTETKEIEDEDLRAALEGLGGAIMRNKQ